MRRLSQEVAAAARAAENHFPVRVLQFGEGNFLRAFIDWMISEMNARGLFRGRVAVVQPLAYGKVAALAEQDNLYTLLLRGIQDGEVVVTQKVIDVIARGINVYSQFDDYLKEAENPDLRIIVSNTTEAGIVLSTADQPLDAPPASYPGKLLRLMKHRYDLFAGDPAKGFLLFPCELIDRNGDRLKAVLTELAQRWYPQDRSFLRWLSEANVYFNTLVDRIVSGYPHAEAEALCRELGYTDELMTAAEPFHFLAVEGPAEYEQEFPLVTAGLNVKWCDDITPYRTRKVRILNGAHTLTVPAAYLAGLETVGDCMDDELFALYIRKGIFDEIIPTLELPEEELTSFGHAVLERFSNPYIRHALLSISLNSVSKFKTRVLPSILEYHRRKGALPELLTSSLAALVLFYRGRERADHVLKAIRPVDGRAYEICDSAEVLDFFFALWRQSGEPDLDGCRAMMEIVLGNKQFWAMDLNLVDGLKESCSQYLLAMVHQGVAPVLRHIVGDAL